MNIEVPSPPSAVTGADAVEGFVRLMSAGMVAVQKAQKGQVSWPGVVELLKAVGASHAHGSLPSACIEDFLLDRLAAAILRAARTA